MRLKREDLIQICEGSERNWKKQWDAGSENQ